ATLSPYIFFWQASEEAEEQKGDPDQKPLKQAPGQAPAQLRRIQIDTAIGMAFANLVAYFIVLTCAATLHVKGIVTIDSAAEAAEALRPSAGRLATLLFALGIIGTGLLAIPVLAGSAAYAIGEVLRWRVGLAQPPERAKGFYGVLALSVMIGLGITFSGIHPIRALFWAAVLNGVVASPILAMMMRLASRAEVMGRFTLSPPLKRIGWLATAALSAAAVGLIVTSAR
ncbi:MAG TPA: divalent metal cation transporter, partial [Candidatus Manganitrophaceae bacterium]|nr:divalent metal cation transporter [Candidatus Manganitrophaceae bacterium]